MKKTFKIIVIIICFVFLSNTIFGASTSLKDLKDELAKDIANKNELIAKQKEVQKKINSLEKDLEAIAQEIDECEKGIDEAKAKIIELNEKIIAKGEEIKSLLSFEQISDGDNVYLEYVFGASSFTDFIYRSALVEQLTEYNDNLIDEMNALIKENEELQEELKEKIAVSEKKSKEMEAKLRSYDLSMDDLSEDQVDIEADIKARQEEINYYSEQYRKNNCSETTDIYSCIGVPYANGFTRPLEKGTITSEFGMRFHPTLNYWRLHSGIDIGVAKGTNVYATAAGVVSKITVKSSCGGNMVYIQHNIDGTKYRSLYMHLSKVNVSVGDVVTMTTVIAQSGGGESYDNCSTGPHLHFSIMSGWTGSSYLNPRNYVEFPAKGKKFTSRF